MVARTLAVVFVSIAVIGCGGPTAEPELLPGRTGPYLGQRLPGTTPELFAPGVVSTTWNARDVSITPDGSEIYFGVYLGRYVHSTVMMTRLAGDRWTRPEVASFAADPATHELEAQVAPDGTRLLFLSDRPTGTGGPGGEDIWVVERQGDGWGRPANLGGPVNTEDDEYFPSLTRGGTLYFTRQTKGGRTTLWRARPGAEGLEVAEQLPEVVNSSPAQFNAFVDPDERFLLFAAAGREDSLGGADYYVCFRSPEDAWSEPVHLPSPVSSAAREEYSASVSPDGRVLFFMSDRAVDEPSGLPDRLTARWFEDAAARPGHGNSCVWWVDAGFLERLRPEGF